ncbi:MAG: type II toxin-antitoxin system RelE/ParE family toxin [bacterium]
MNQPLFQTLTTPGFEREIKRLARKDPGALERIEDLVTILKNDPYNLSRAYDIRKLTAIKVGEGQFRIRSGDFRLRYDIVGKDVVLYSARDRKEAY